MKVEEKIKDTFINNLSEHLDEERREQDQSLYMMRDARSVEELMELKCSIMSSIVSSIPLGYRDCYFCIKFGAHVSSRRCSRCPYGKIHRICHLGGSDYKKMKSAKLAMREAIRSYHHPNSDKYEDDEHECNQEIVIFIDEAASIPKDVFNTIEPLQNGKKK